MKRKILFISCLLLVPTIVVPAAIVPVFADNNSVNFYYDVCYEGGSNRVDKLTKGSKAVNWRAKRRNYFLDGWYADPDYEKLYDFNTAVETNTVVYAKWLEGSGKNNISVTFDYNYENCPQPVTFNIHVGEKINVDDVPIPSRFGFTTTGWYKDKGCSESNKVSFLNDSFSETTTLYAGYSKKEGLNFDDKGKPIFNNVEIDFAPNILSWGGGAPEIDTMTAKFNNEYSGKIHVNLVPFNTTETVTFEDTGFINEYKEDYYNIGEVLKAINMPFDDSDYYMDAISENYIAGTLKSVPVIHSVPFMIYNKQLLAQMGLSEFPTDHEGIYNLLVRANDYFGNKAGWKGALSQSEYNWSNFEIGHHVIWSNSNFRFMDYDEATHSYVNNFAKKENENVLYDAFVGGNRIFGYNSAINSGYDDNFFTDFANGNSLACFAGYSTQFTSLRNRLSSLNDKAFVQKYGVVPVNDLTNYGKHQNSHVFAKGYSMGIRTSTLDLNQVAASAIFSVQ